MEDRTFELLEKLYLDMQDMKTEIKGMKDVMVVKDDLKNFATKDDIKNFATKDDIKNFVTKDDIKKLATKDDLEMISKQLHMEIQTVYEEVLLVHEEVQGLRNDLNTMEMVTAKNSYDIAILKAVRQ